MVCNQVHSTIPRAMHRFPFRLPKLSLDGPVQYWGGGPPGKRMVLNAIFPFCFLFFVFPKLLFLLLFIFASCCSVPTCLRAYVPTCLRAYVPVCLCAYVHRTQPPDLSLSVCMAASYGFVFGLWSLFSCASCASCILGLGSWIFLSCFRSACILNHIRTHIQTST